MLKFDENVHEYKLNGKIVPSVTKAINNIPEDLRFNSAFIRKQRIGTEVHLLAHQLKKREKLSKDLLTDDNIPYFEGYKKFHKEGGFVLLHSEVRVFSKLYNYAGTVDDVALSQKEKLCVMDIKCTAELSPTTGLQTGGYAIAIDEMIRAKNEIFIDLASRKVQERWCIWLTGDGNYKLIPYRNKDDYNVFLCAMTYLHWQQKNKLI
jgi:hypothetical protein